MPPALNGLCGGSYEPSPEEEKVRCPDADKAAAAAKAIFIAQVARCSWVPVDLFVIVRWSFLLAMFYAFACSLEFLDVAEALAIKLFNASSQLPFCAPLSRWGSMSVVTRSLKSTRPELLYFCLYRITPDIRHDLLEVARLLYTKLRRLRTF